MINTLSDGYNILPTPAAPPALKAMPFAVQLNVGTYNKPSTPESFPRLEKVINTLFFCIPCFCFQLIGRFLLFVAAICLTVWGFAHGPLWCLVAVFIHFPIAIWCLRVAFGKWPKITVD